MAFYIRNVLKLVDIQYLLTVFSVSEIVISFVNYVVLLSDTEAPLEYWQSSHHWSPHLNVNTEWIAGKHVVFNVRSHDKLIYIQNLWAAFINIDYL